MKKIMVGLMLVAVMVALSGCKYVRLMQFKNQFQNPSKHFVFVKSVTQPSIKCLHPVLKPEDIDMLTGGVTPSIFKQKNGMEWHYVMEKINASSNDTQTTLVVRLCFDADQNLTQVFYPYQFSSLVHPDFVPTLLESFGKGSPNPHSKTVQAEPKFLSDDWIPSRDKIIAHLGTPTQEITSKNTTLMIYTYIIKSTPKPAYPYIWITLDNTSQKAIGVKTTVFGGEISLQSQKKEKTHD